MPTDGFDGRAVFLAREYPDPGQPIEASNCLLVLQEPERGPNISGTATQMPLRCLKVVQTKTFSSLKLGFAAHRSASAGASDNRYWLSSFEVQTVSTIQIDCAASHP